MLILRESWNADSKLHHLVRLLYTIFAFHVPALSKNPAAVVSANRNSTSDTSNLLITAANVLTGICSWPLPSLMLQSILPVVLQLFVGGINS